MHGFLWIKDCVIQIIFISIAIIFTVTIAHMSIRELYTDYYMQQLEYKSEALERNTQLLLESVDMPDLRHFAVLDERYFLEFSREMTVNLYTSLIRGILIMVAGFTLFTMIINLWRKHDDFEDDDEDDDRVVETRKSDSPPRLLIQLLSMAVFGVLAWMLFMLQGILHGVAQSAAILFAGLFLGMAIAHIVRMLLWIISKGTGQTKSSYPAQTTQFCVFLMVFLTMFSLSMHNGFTAHIEASRLDELRINSLIASLTISTDAGMLSELDFGEHSESFVVARNDNGTYYILGDDSKDISHAYDLFATVWEEQASVMGIRGDFMYGATVIIEPTQQSVVSLSIVRRPVAILAEELFNASLDFVLVMSATVFAFIFLFIELNKLLEAINVPNYKRERELRYAAGAKSLNFLITICQAIPAYFFVLIVFNIYEHSPIEWLPSEYAVILPLAVVLFMMVVGGEFVGKIIRLLPRRMMILGCLMGAAGFIAMDFAWNLPIWLLFLAITYLGISITYMELQKYISDAAGSGYREFRTLGEETLSGEYLGCTTGAVIGAIVFDQFGLFAAFVLSAAIMLLLAVLIRCMLPLGEIEKQERGDFGFFRFLFSKRILMFVGFLMAPFIVGEFFIRQFAPLYADSINLSPGAASWTYLLMTMAAAFAAPFAARALAGLLRKITICVFANLLSASGLVLFSVFPGILTMYIASALLGFSIGTGTSMVESGYSDLEEAKEYKRSGFVFKMFGVVFGQLGVVLFTVAHSMSPGGEYVLIVAGIIAIPTLLYFMFTRQRAPQREKRHF